MARDSIWALVLNTTRARILRGLDLRGMSQESELVVRSRQDGLLALLNRAALPPRAVRRRAPVYLAPDHQDAFRLDAEIFAREVVMFVDAHRRASDFGGLYVASSPSMMLILDGQLPQLLRTKIRVIVAADLVREPASRLSAAFARGLQVKGRQTQPDR